MITTYERGKIDERRETVVLQLDARFGSLTPEIQQRVAEMTPEQLRQLMIDLIKRPTLSLKELHLEN